MEAIGAGAGAIWAPPAGEGLGLGAQEGLGRARRGSAGAGDYKVTERVSFFVALSLSSARQFPLLLLVSELVCTSALRGEKWRPRAGWMDGCPRVA